MGEATETRTPDTQLFYDVFNASPIGIAVENLEGQPLFVNPALCSMLGFSEEELCSKHCVQFSPPEDSQKDWALFQQLRAGSIDHYHLEKRYFRRDGSLIWGLLSVSMLNSRPSPLVIAMVEDITDKKRAEEALRASQERLLLALEAGAAGGWEWEIKSDRTLWVGKAPDLLGLTASEYSGSRQGFWDRVHPDDRGWLEDNFRASRQNHTEFSEEFRVVWPDGSVHWLRSRGRYYYGADGEPERMFGISVDITDRKAAEEALRKSEEKFSKAFRQSPLAFTLTRMNDHLFLDVNATFERLTGWRRDEVIGRPVPDFGIWADPAQRIEFLKRVLDDGALHDWEIRFRRKDGAERVGLGSAELIEIGGETCVLFVLADITDKRKAEEALRASEERLRLAQRAARIGAFEVDVRTWVNTWTPELEALYGLPPGGFAGTQAAFEKMVHPDDLEEVTRLVDAALKSGQPTRGQWRVIWPDASVHWIAGHWQVFMNEAGQASRMVGINLDVTERKLAEDKLSEYERAVEGSDDMICVIDREYRYLIANRRYLKMHNLAREQVVGRFVHEILNPVYFESMVKVKMKECFQGKVVRFETKYTYPGVDERDLLISYFPIERAEGIDRLACIVHDITDRKRAEEALAAMSGKLIEAQEQERTRIGRELHDDINQRLALLAVEIETSKQNPPGFPEDVCRLLTGIQERIAEVSSEVEALSHQLHSSQLAYLGVVTAMKSFCRELAGLQKVEIDFTHDDIPKSVPDDVSLCLFRVLQEALHNAVRHSNVRHFQVRLGRSANQLHLMVSDGGTGFDIERATSGGGLGLISMRERVRLVRGAIVIDSKPTGGTTIHVRVPLASEHSSQNAAGLTE